MKNASVWWPVISQLRPETISFSKRKICFANRKGSFRYGSAGSEDLQPHYVASLLRAQLLTFLPTFKMLSTVKKIVCQLL